MRATLQSAALHAALLMLAICSMPPARAQAAFSFDLPAEPLADSLRAVASETHTDVIFDPHVVSGLTAPPLRGTATAQQAVAELLAHTGLQYVKSGERTLRVVRVEPTRTSDRSTRSDASDDLQSPPDQGSQGSEPTGPQVASEAREGRTATTPATSSPVNLEQVVVTGTHLQGIKNSPSPVLVFTQADIEQSGASNLAQFIQTLPQNFNGGDSVNTMAGVAGGGAATNNDIAGTGVNLRGLGNDATIVLIDGHRVAPADTAGSFVDLSLIPLSAIERVEVVTDGASAIYGSDAVGGVVNVILRKSYDGEESRVRYGTVADGSSHDTQAAQTAGTSWRGGSALVSYEFDDSTPLSAADRSFSNTAPQPFTLLPEQVRQSAVLSVNQDLTPGTNLFAEGMYSRRAEYEDISTPLYSQYLPATVTAYDAIVGADSTLSRAIQLEGSLSYSHDDTFSEVIALAPPPVGQPLSENRTSSDVFSADAVSRGSLWSFDDGTVEYALGGQYREESYDDMDLLGGAPFNPSRSVSAGFVELHVPIPGLQQTAAGDSRVALSLADRYEDYSDFGTTNNPQIGITWNPTEALRFRGTFGTSFVAPLLSELNPVPFQVVGFNTDILPGAAPPSGGNVNALLVFGGNAHLEAQNATTWTAGADWSPSGSSGVRATLTLYGTRFTNRIANLQQAGYDPILAFPLESLLGPEIIERNPPSSLVQQLIGLPVFDNFGANLADISAIVNDAWLNISKVETTGIDFGASYRTDVGRVHLETGLDGTYILKMQTQFTSGTPIIDTLNTPYNPTRVKMRGRVIVTRGSFSVASFVNFVSAYQNSSVMPVAPVASWTTLDLTATYRCQSCSGLLGKLTALLSVQNIANRNPPFVANASGFAVNFDGANANALGRYYSVQLTQQW